MSTRAAQIEIFTDPLLDPTTGGLCSGYTAYFYAAGTSTLKNVWTEKEKTNPFTSYLLDSGGKVLLYGDGIYKIIVKNVEGTTVLTLDNQKIQATTYSVVQKTGNYTATPDDDVILCNGTFTISLASVATFEHPVIIKSIGTGTITIDPYGSETIDGSSTVAIVNQYDAITLYPDTTSNIWRKSGSLTADLNGTELILDEDGDTSITADTDDTIDVKANGTDQLQITSTQIDFKPGGTSQVVFKDGVVEPTTDNDIDLGSSSKEFKDLYVDGTANIDAANISALSTDGITINSIAQGKDVTVAIHRKIVEIGDWNMDATNSVNVTHGLTSTKIRCVSVIIQNDAENITYPIDYCGVGLAASVPEGEWYIYGATYIILTRRASTVGGYLFDSADFNATSFNRGWVVIEYVD